MKKYKVPTGLKYVVAFIYCWKGEAINYCIKNNVDINKIEIIEDNEENRIRK